MPKLPAPLQDAVDNAPKSEFEPLEPGVYTARLAEVQATQTKSGNNPGTPMWALTFDEVRDLDGGRKPGRLWTNLVLADSTMWKVNQFFAAFGAPSATDTDEMINHRIRLQVEKRVITQGKRTGQEGNEIGGFVALNTTDEGFEALAKLQRSLGNQSATPKKAAAKSAAAPVEEQDGEVITDDDDIEF